MCALTQIHVQMDSQLVLTSLVSANLIQDRGEKAVKTQKQKLSNEGDAGHSYRGEVYMEQL